MHEFFNPHQVTQTIFKTIGLRHTFFAFMHQCHPFRTKLQGRKHLQQGTWCTKMSEALNSTIKAEHLARAARVVHISHLFCA